MLLGGNLLVMIAEGAPISLGRLETLLQSWRAVGAPGSVPCLVLGGASSLAAAFLRGSIRDSLSLGPGGQGQWLWVVTLLIPKRWRPRLLLLLFVSSRSLFQCPVQALISL